MSFKIVPDYIIPMLGIITRMTSQSLRAFMTGIIDYAGLYPPTNLPLEVAFRNFIKYLSDVEAWMLARFVVPARRLGELAQFMDEFPNGGPLIFSCVGRGGTDASEFVENLKLDLADIELFRNTHKQTVIADMFETSLPAKVLEDKTAAHELVKDATELLNMNGIAVFFEAPFGDGWQERADLMIRSLRKIKDKHVGFKLRTGGVAADNFPSPEQVAWAIVATREAGIPIKCTAGLHHPIRHYNESVSTKMHGFLNVFGAGLLALTNDLSQEQIASIVADENPANFTFDDGGFAWNDLRVDKLGIEEQRHRMTSFGSCSFDEPREDLQSLGLLK